MPLFVRRKPADDRFEIATESGVVAVDIRRHPRARNFTLRVAGPARPPILTMPKRGSVRDAQRFLERHSAWLTRQLARLPRPNPIAAGGEIPVRGAPHVIRHAGRRRGTAVLRLEGERPELVVAGDPAHLSRRVVDFLKREARRDLTTAVNRHAARLEVRPTAVRLRDQTSRWGSCSAGGQLSFSWRLIMAPPFVLMPPTKWPISPPIIHAGSGDWSRRCCRAGWPSTAPRSTPSRSNATPAGVWLGRFSATIGSE